MLRPSRLGLAAAVALLAAPVARAAEVDRLLPADSEAVVVINFRQALDSEIVKKYALGQLKDVLAGGDAQKVLKELGIDPLKDVDRVSVGLSGLDPDTNFKDIKGLAVIRGKFDPQKLYKAAEAQTRKDADHFSLIKDGQDVIFKYQPDDGVPVYGTVVNNTTLVVGSDKKLVTAALAASGGDAKPALHKDLAAIINRVDDKTAVFACGLTKDKLAKLPIPQGGGAPAGLKDQLGKLDTITLAIRVTADISLEVNFGMADEKSADELGKTVDDGLTQLKGLVPFLVANDPKAKPLADAAKSLKSGVKGKTVSISGTLPGDAIGKLLNPGD